MRSLVVTQKDLGRGLGRRLVDAVEILAAETGVRSIYLLTTSAEAFFEYLGFRRISREETPAAIRSTREFSSLCPATAVVMVKPWVHALTMSFSFALAIPRAASWRSRS